MIVQAIDKLEKKEPQRLPADVRGYLIKEGKNAKLSIVPVVEKLSIYGK